MALFARSKELPVDKQEGGLVAGPSRDEIDAVIKLVTDGALSYLASVDERPARTSRVADALAGFSGVLPEEGVGAVAALTRLIEDGFDAAVATAGPRSFHFVIGGVTPAALGADWLTSTLDQMAYAAVASPLATTLELIALQWLQALFALPASWQGVMTTGATMANFVCLAAARQWAGAQVGVDVAEEGVHALEGVRLYASDIIHPSDIKAVGMLGLGRANVVKLAAGEAGTLDLAALERALQEDPGAPAIVMAVAGEPNASHFDPIADLAALVREHNAWLHVDGAFGLYAALSPSHAALVAGVERAHSVAVDGHKWLNVPYDCGFAFVHDGALLAKAFTHSAAYLPDPTAAEVVLGAYAPEMSRRARALAVWATLYAYGREGIRHMVVGCIELAHYLGRLVAVAPDLELLVDVTLNVVCFRYNPGGLDEVRLNALNEALGDKLLEDGRVFVGTTTYDGKVALRPSIVNWRTRAEDVEILVATVRELGARIVNEGDAPRAGRCGAGAKV
jgi:glutamate/tyrosine decarboxylase-like PLP-dependent enzyme